jgi:MFS transporter, PAT family, beta-lactamase induction signal transducer AmpG
LIAAGDPGRRRRFRPITWPPGTWLPITWLRGPAHEPPLWLNAGFGFACGLPFPLSSFTLRFWLSGAGISLQAIGLTAAIGLAYILKFVWAPALDSARPLARRFGRRRGWLVLIQPALSLACVAVALGDPATPLKLVICAVAVAFLSASQDICVDAWRIESYALERQGLALAFYVWGYRGALLVSGAGAIGASAYFGWHIALLGVAALSLIGLATTLLAPEGPPPQRHPGLGWARHLRDAIIGPLRDMLGRPSAGLILAFVALFKLGEALAGTMAAPFYQAMGFDRQAVALATGLPSLAASLAGAALGGALVVRIGAGRALVLTGFVQIAAMGTNLLLAVSHGDPRFLLLKVIVEGLAEAMADAAFLTFLAGLCSAQYTATQYALLSSLAAAGLHTVAGFAGFLAAPLGWVHFYALSMLSALPAMAIMLVLLRSHRVAWRSGETVGEEARPGGAAPWTPAKDSRP